MDKKVNNKFCKSSGESTFKYFLQISISLVPIYKYCSSLIKRTSQSASKDFCTALVIVKGHNKCPDPYESKIVKWGKDH